MARTATKTTKKAVKKAVTKRAYVRKPNIEDVILSEREARIAQVMATETRIDAIVGTVASTINSLDLRLKIIEKERDEVAGAEGTPAKASYIHEISNDKRFHRILKIGHSETAAVGKWFEFEKIATLDELYAATSYFIDTFPEGIFSVNELPHVSI